MQVYTKRVFRCHLAPDHQAIMKEARKQCWGARSDSVNRKQATICIPGQAVQHKTDTGSDTEAVRLSSNLKPYICFAPPNGMSYGE